LAPDKSKLSKRKHGESVSVHFYRKAGYLPEALINFVALIGWNPGGDKEIFSMHELLEIFDIDRVQKSPGVFNIEKLNWLNKEYIKMMPADERIKKISEFIPDSLRTLPEFKEAILSRLEPLITEHINTFGDVQKMSEEGALTFFFKKPVIEAEALIFKHSNKEDARMHLEKDLEILEGIDETAWSNTGELKAKILAYADTLPKRGPALHPLRYALSGREQSPDPFSIAALIGKEETLARVRLAISLLA